MNQPSPVEKRLRMERNLSNPDDNSLLKGLATLGGHDHRKEGTLYNDHVALSDYLFSTMTLDLFIFTLRFKLFVHQMLVLECRMLRNN